MNQKHASHNIWAGTAHAFLDYKLQIAKTKSTDRLIQIPITKIIEHYGLGLGATFQNS